MTRRSKSDGLIGLALLLAIVAIVIVVASICVPIIFAVGYIYYRIKRQKQYSHLSGSLSDFWLSSTEKARFMQLASTVVQSQQAINAANQRAVRAGLDRNLDGRFSARSNLGKEIRQIEEHNQAIISKYRGDYENYRDLPNSRWLEFRETFACEKAFFVSLCTWVVSALILIGGVYLFYTPPGAPSADGRMMYGTAILCALISLCVFFAYRSYAGHGAEGVTPIPDEVTLENVNNY